MAKRNPNLPPDFFATLNDDQFEKLLRENLASVQPPPDFSGRVMAAIQQEAAAPPTKVFRFPLRRVFAGTGICAAAVLLFAFISISPDNTAGIPLNKPLQTAAEPFWQMPSVQQVTTPEPVEIELPTPAKSPAQPAEPIIAAEPDISDEPTQTGELILPRAAFGATSEGMLSTRMLASVPGNHIYSPDLNSRCTSAIFHTVDGTNLYSWRVNLENGTEPQIAIISEIEPGMTADCQPTTKPCTSTTIVESPDGMILAQNADGEDKGIWIALKEGDVYRLTIEGGGDLLLWSKDSARLIFTNSEGHLYVGYPLEKRIYRITDMQVKDICLGDDNKTLLFIADENGQDVLYTCQLL